MRGWRRPAMLCGCWAKAFCWHSWFLSTCALRFIAKNTAAHNDHLYLFQYDHSSINKVCLNVLTRKQCEVIFWGQLKQGVNGGWNAWEGISRMHWSWLTVGEYSQRNWTLMRDFKQFITTVKWRNTCCQNCFCTQVYCQWSAKSISKSDIVLFWKNMATQQLIKTLNKLYGSSITTEKLFGYFTLWSNKIFSFTDRKNQNQIKTTAYGL